MMDISLSFIFVNLLDEFEIYQNGTYYIFHKGIANPI